MRHSERRRPDTAIKRISLTVPIPPAGKATARICKDGRHYTPASTKSFMSVLTLKFNEAKPSGWEPWKGPVAVTMTAYIAIPKRASEEMRFLMRDSQVKPTGKIDLDNVVKMLDSLTRYAFKDDAQITDITAKKRYADDPRVEITLEFN